MLSTSHYEVRLAVFEGPLDLLLSLIERAELDITAISLAQVTGQYLAYLSELEEHRVGDLAAFLVVAAKLLLIKSQALLPRPPPLTSEEEDVGDDLIRQLQLYRQFKEAASHLRDREELGLQSFVRIAAGYRPEPHLNLSGVTLDDLVAAAQEALQALPAAPLDPVVTPIVVTIGEQIEHIQAHLALRQRAQFHDILSRAATRVEVIVTLLALLELIKRDAVVMRQERPFGPITIELAQPVGPSASDAATTPQPA